MRHRAKGVHKLRVGQHHAKPAALSVPDRDGRLSAGELQIAPIQVQGFGLAKPCAPEHLAAAVGQDPAGVSMLRTATVGTVVRSIRYRTASLAVSYTA